MNPKVSIIVLNYNGEHFLKKCIPTIQKQTYKNIEIVVTDNHSTDGSVEYLRTFPNIVILKHKENLGYAKANNLGAKVARGDFLFFLNNDTELFKDTIERLLDCYKDNSIVTARQIPAWNKKFIGSSGSGIDIFGYPYVENDPKKTRVFYADGAMIFIKKKDFIHIGMFDEKLFIFQEDIDLSWRAQLFGYHIISCWQSKLYHYGGGTVLGGVSKSRKYTSSYFRRFLNEKNVIRNIIKNYSFPTFIIILITLLIFHLFEIGALLLLLKWRAILCYLQAYHWNIKNLKNTLSLRKKIQRKRIVSDFTLMKKMYWSYSKLNSLRKVGIPNFR